MGTLAEESQSLREEVEDCQGGGSLQSVRKRRGPNLLNSNNEVLFWLAASCSLERGWSLLNLSLLWGGQGESNEQEDET